MKIGIFGGCFSPPHKSHKKIVYELLNYVDKIIIVPTGNKYNKVELATDIDRIKMLKLIFNDDRIVISDYEFKSELTYTYQTLDHFKEEYPNDDIYFITGTDNIKEIKTWKRYEYLLSTYKFLIVRRGNDDLESTIKEYGNNLIPIFIKFKNISSTQIRQRIKENKSLYNYLDKEVIKYIEDKKLYI